MKLTAKWITSARDYGDVCPSFYKKFSLKKEIKSAAILEAIIQCWGGKVHLLRALPNEWKDGRLCGVKIPGGHTVSLS